MDVVHSHGLRGLRMERIAQRVGDRHTGDSAVTGYNIYYDEAGKSKPATSVQSS